MALPSAVKCALLPQILQYAEASMQLGFVSAILPELSFEEICRIGAGEGYDCIEVMCWPPGKAERRYAGVTHIDAAALDSAAVDSIQGALQRHGIAISGLGYYPNPLSRDPREANVAQRHLRLVIQAAEVLGLSTVNTFVGRDWTRSVEENWPRFLDVWRRMVAVCRVPRHSHRHRELPHDLHPGRVARGQESRLLPCNLEPDVRGHPQPVVRLELRSFSPDMDADERHRAASGFSGPHLPCPCEGRAGGPSLAGPSRNTRLPTSVPHAQAAGTREMSTGGSSSRC